MLTFNMHKPNQQGRGNNPIYEIFIDQRESLGLYATTSPDGEYNKIDEDSTHPVIGIIYFGLDTQGDFLLADGRRFNMYFVPVPSIPSIRSYPKENFGKALESIIDEVFYYTEYREDRSFKLAKEAKKVTSLEELKRILPKLTEEDLHLLEENFEFSEVQEKAHKLDLTAFIGLAIVWLAIFARSRAGTDTKSRARKRIKRLENPSWCRQRKKTSW